MASLTHVCVWTDGSGWTPVSAEDPEIRAIGKVSANSGLFMCGLCHQFVFLAHGDQKDPYFGHSPAEDKSCPERVLGSSAVQTFNASDYSLPLRLVVANKSFHLELGLPCIPNDKPGNLGKLCICIQPADYLRQPFIFDLAERMRDHSITWLPLGSTPSKSYTITSTALNSNILLWPSKVKGVASSGALFHYLSGNMLPIDSDVQVEKEYYLLKKGQLNPIHSIQSKFIAKCKDDDQSWYLYQIKATEFSNYAAKFFLRYHYRLTIRPVTVLPIWPVYIETPFILRHNRNIISFYISGEDISTKCFPDATKEEFPGKSGSLIQLNTHSRQQMIATGRFRPIRYTYLWTDPLTNITEQPDISVTTIQDETIPSGIAKELPMNNILRILLREYDGTATIIQNSALKEKRMIKAGAICEISSVSFGTEVQVYVGLDCIWSVSFQRQRTERQTQDANLVCLLEQGNGPLRQVSSSLGGIEKALRHYPMVKKWIRKKIREGYMPETSFQRLRQLVEQSK